MDEPPPEIAFTLGARIRAARYRRRLTLAAVAQRTGVSTSTLSRMELGRGAGVALATWVTVAVAVGADLFAPPRDERGVYPEAIAGMLARGGWSMTARQPDALWFERPMRPLTGLRRGVLPAERAVVRLIRVLSDVDEEFRRLGSAIDQARDDAPPGLVVAGTVVVVRSTDALRRSARAGYRLSSGRWLSAFRSPVTRMPRYPGWLWLAPEGTHLLPWAG